jgi:prepilin-type N-terminal cleavage/methylation domain-containing protein
MNKQRGFTLIEMMIVVAIIGILASIATPAFVKYVKTSKTSEAGLNLKSLSDGAAAYFQTDHYGTDGRPVATRQFPGTDGKHPAAVPKGTKAPAVTNVWSAAPWKDLKFAVMKAHYYQYEYNYVSPGVFTSNASGDLDADGTPSIFRITGSGDNLGEVSLSPVFVPPGADPLE